MRLALKNINKHFSGQAVLQGVDLRLEAGHILALMGENGAGKSTLMNILCGAYQDFLGDILVDGHPCHFTSPKDGEEAGVIMVHQELNLLPELSLVDNIFLGAEEYSSLGLLNKSVMRERAKQVLAQLGLNLDPGTKLKQLSIGQQQLIEIARALVRQAKILILEEPSAALSEQETLNLFVLLKKLAQQGVAIIYISHRIDELSQIASHLCVLRNGSIVASGLMSQFQESEIIQLMIGAELSQQHRAKSSISDSEIPFLTVKNLSLITGQKTLRDISFDLHEGEILGLTGLLGSGCGELLQGLFGDKIFNSASVTLNGKPALAKSPRQAIDNGIVYISDDRKNDSLLLEQSLDFNLTMPQISQQSSERIICNKPQTQKLLQQWTVKHHSTEQNAGSLSGGNQQKLVIARWLSLSPKLVLMNEPTRGVDIGAKAEIYQILEDLRDQGVSFIIASTDLPELCRLSDRVIVLRNGQIFDEFKHPPFLQNELLNSAQGNRKELTRVE